MEEIHIDLLATYAGIVALIVVVIELAKKLGLENVNAPALVYRWIAVGLGVALSVLGSFVFGDAGAAMSAATATLIAYWLFIVLNGMLAGLAATAGYESVVNGMNRAVTTGTGDGG